MPKKSTAIGLDIGSNIIKIAELQRVNNEVQLKQYGTIPLPFGSLENGAIKDSQTVAQAIRELITNLEIKVKEAVIAVSGQSAIVRLIKFPYMSREELTEALKWEAERYIPYQIDDACYDFEIINQDKENNEIEIVLVATHKDLIMSHIRCMNEAGIQPRAIDIQPFALMRALGLEKVDPEAGSIGLLDIGAATTDLTIVKRGAPQFTRIIPLAGNRLTESVRKLLDISFDEAEQAKMTHSNALCELHNTKPGSIEYSVNFAILEGLREMVLELHRSFDYYRLQQRNEKIEKLIIVGGGSKMRNLPQYLTNELELEVVTVGENPLIKLEGHSSYSFKNSLPTVSVALGLSLREVINL